MCLAYFFINKFVFFWVNWFLVNLVDKYFQYCDISLVYYDCILTMHSIYVASTMYDYHSLLIAYGQIGCTLGVQLLQWVFAGLSLIIVWKN